ncbi:hypothetical protein J6590_094616 [Homalodisca vitripennis]|nr:hypothetical protein J6590_094616 [Homalodisca vitripennis]
MEVTPICQQQLLAANLCNSHYQQTLCGVTASKSLGKVTYRRPLVLPVTVETQLLTGRWTDIDPKLCIKLTISSTFYYSILEDSPVSHWWIHSVVLTVYPPSRSVP